MLQKKEGETDINKLRIINLWNANSNFNFKLLAYRMMRNAETHNLVPDKQYGSQNGLSAQ